MSPNSMVQDRMVSNTVPENSVLFEKNVTPTSNAVLAIPTLFTV